MLVIWPKLAPDRVVTPSSALVFVALNRSNWKAAVPGPIFCRFSTRKLSRFCVGKRFAAESSINRTSAVLRTSPVVKRASRAQTPPLWLVKVPATWI